MRVLQLNYDYEANLTAPAELLQRYTTLTGWSEALLAAGATQVTVVQRFHQDATLQRNSVAYEFCVDGSLRALRLNRRAASAQPDLAHVNGLFFPIQLWHLRRELPKSTAIVVQDHGGYAALRFNFLRRFIYRRALGAADGFMFAATALADVWRAAGVFTPTQPIYEVMESSAALQPTSRETARAASGVVGEPAVLWVGRLNANKDPLTVLDGFERALSQLPNAHLTMVYSTEELLSQIQARLAASPLLAQHVHLRGPVPHNQLTMFYSAADLFVLGSHHEGSGYALGEALACGVAPVVTDIPSFRMLTANGALGALWRVADADAFARALITVSQRDLTALRAAIRNHFERELTWSAIGKRALAAYTDAIARHSNTP
jgi:glycosyltransferase involved in cell wall biosynthesis